MGSLGLWIFATIVVLIGYGIFIVIRKAIEKATALKQPDLQTPLPEFKETHGLRQQLNSIAFHAPHNISERFEEMCILHPLQYKNDPTLPEVIANYKSLLNGEILDVEGRHVPSVKINGARNPDYQTYLESQKKALAKAQVARVGVNQELGRLDRLDAEDNARADLLVELLKMNIPVSVLNGALVDEKINEYTAEDWKDFGKIVKDYLSEYPEEIVAEFMCAFHSHKIVFDSDKMEQFAIFRKYQVPMRVVKEIIQDRITVIQAQKIMILVQRDDYKWDEAIQEVIEEDLKEAAEQDLRSTYRNALNA